MSRIGNKIIEIPAGVSVEVSNSSLPTTGHSGSLVSVTGPNGTVLVQEVRAKVFVVVEGDKIHVKRHDDENQSKAYHGLYNRLIQNMIVGVTKGFTKTLILNGVGYKAAMKGENLMLNLGMSHPSEVKAEKGIKLKVCTPQEVQALNLGKEGVGAVIQVSGASKEQVGMMASKIRDLRPVEPYHLYGIRYSNERVVRKESKSGAKGKKK